MRKNIVIMNIMVLLFWMSMNVYAPNLPEYAQSMGATAMVLGIIGGVYGIAQVVMRVPIAIFSGGGWKSRRMLFWGNLLLMVSAAILVFAGNPGLLVVGRTLAGASAAWWVIQSSTYADYHCEEKQVAAQGRLVSSMNWGKMGAALVGGLVAQYLGMRLVFILAFIIAAACIVFNARLKDEPAPVPKQGNSSFRDLVPLFKNKDFMAFNVMGILPNILCFAAPTLFTMVAAGQEGASSFDMGLLNVVFYAFFAVSSLFVGSRLYKKIGGVHVVAIAFAITGFACLPVFYHISLPVIYVMQAVSGVGGGIATAAVGGLVNCTVSSAQRPMCIGIYNCINALGVFLGPILAGGIIEVFSFDAAYWTLVAIAAVSAALCYILIPPKYGAM